MAKPNLIIDTTSLLGASRLGSVPAQACQWAHKYYNIVHSRETLDELLDVAARPRIQQVFGRQPLYDMIKHSPTARFLLRTRIISIRCLRILRIRNSLNWLFRQGRDA